VRQAYCRSGVRRSVFTKHFPHCWSGKVRCSHHADAGYRSRLLCCARLSLYPLLHRNVPDLLLDLWNWQ
jgi:hypothetical protein